MPPYHHFPYGGYGPGPYGGGPPSPGGQLIVFALSNIMWIGLIGLVLWTAMQSFRGTARTPLPRPARKPSPLELLRRRYIMGEIDVMTFEEQLQQLLESEERERIYKLL
jgi:uncharacterized membrane protein